MYRFIALKRRRIFIELKKHTPIGLPVTRLRVKMLLLCKSIGDTDSDASKASPIQYRYRHHRYRH